MEENKLRELESSGRIVKIYLMNGYQIWGRITDHNDKVIILQESKTGETMMIYRHGICTIVLRGESCHGKG